VGLLGRRPGSRAFEGEVAQRPGVGSVGTRFLRQEAPGRARPGIGVHRLEQGVARGLETREHRAREEEPRHGTDELVDVGLVDAVETLVLPHPPLLGCHAATGPVEHEHGLGPTPRQAGLHRVQVCEHDPAVGLQDEARQVRVPVQESQRLPRDRVDPDVKAMQGLGGARQQLQEGRALDDPSTLPR